MPSYGDFEGLFGIFGTARHQGLKVNADFHKTPPNPDARPPEIPFPYRESEPARSHRVLPRRQAGRPGQPWGSLYAAPRPSGQRAGRHIPRRAAGTWAASAAPPPPARPHARAEAEQGEGGQAGAYSPPGRV